MRTSFVSILQAVQLEVPSCPLPCIGLLEELQQLLCRGTTLMILHGMCHMVAACLFCVQSLGLGFLPHIHCLFQKKKKKERKKGGREGKKNLKLFLSSGDLHVVARHAQPVACFVLCHVLWQCNNFDPWGGEAEVGLHH